MNRYARYLQYIDMLPIVSKLLATPLFTAILCTILTLGSAGFLPVCALDSSGPGSRTELEAAVKADPYSASAHRQLGIFYLKNRDLTGANTELGTALRLDSSDQEAAHSLIGLWQEQLAKAPSANAHFGLGRAYQLSGALDSAQAEYREVVRLDPNNPALPAARQSFKRALARREAEKDLKQAEVLESQGHLTEACQLVSQAMVYSPGNTDYKLYQAELLTKLGQGAMAKQIYLNVLRDDPENITALQCVQQLSAAAGQAATVPGTTILLPPSTANSQAAASTAATVPAAPSSAGSAPSSGIQPLSSFLRQLRDKVFDQNENQAGPELTTSPVADPAGMLHGPGDSTTPSTAGGAGRLNAGGL
jgi:tetratricopeptide (TPR) repeat protein